MRRTFTKAIIVASILLFIFSVSTAFAAPSINLPTDPVQAKFDYPGPNSYWKITLSGVDAGYDVSNGAYVGWCVDEDHSISNHATRTVTLYSSYDPANLYSDDDWDLVNWILNHKQGSDWWDVQRAIWYFIDGGVYPTGYPDAIDMVEDAMVNGENFEPGPGQILAVVCWIGVTVQTTFIEVTVPLNNVVPEYPIGPILGSVSFVIALGFFKGRHALPTVFRFKRD